MSHNTEVPTSSMSTQHHEKEEKANQKVPFYKLFTFADPLDVALMTIGTICAMANGWSQPIMTLILGKLINTFGSTDPSNTIKEVSKVSLLFVYLAIAIGVVSFLQVACWMVTGERQAPRIRSLYLKTILKQDIAFFDTETTTGEVIGRMSGDTILIQDSMGEKVGKFIQLASTFIGGFVIAFVRGWQLAVILLSCIPCVVVTGGILSMLMTKMSSRGQAAYSEAGTVAEQTVGSIRTVAYKTMVLQGMASGFGLGVLMLIIFCTYALAMWYGSKLVIEKGYNGGTVITVIVALMTGGISLGQTSPCLNAFAAGQAAAYKMFETIKRKPKIDAYDTSGVVMEDIRGDIELRDVYFSYPARKNVQIFSGFSLYVPSGTTAALVGQSGSGKSTVISLLERFYDPDAGEVLIDGINLKNFQVRWIREQIGLVSQEPILFAASIKENIIYGKEGATDEEIKSAITLANAKTFIDKLPQGLETMAGQNGTQLSGGQKQRIAIARAILKNPRILLLDEATSALDAESERVVQEALEQAMSKRTTVVVAHRLTTIRNADTIAVVHQGKIVEEGTHDELIKDVDGAYSQLIRLQEGAKEAKGSNNSEAEKSSNKVNLDSNIARSSTQREVSLNRGSSSRHSQSHSFALSHRSWVHESVEVEKYGDVEKSKVDTKKPNKVSLRRLAYLNKPEVPVLVVGSVAAIIHGLVFPLFGFLFSSAITMFFEPPEKQRKDSRFWALLYVGLGLVTLVVIPIQNYFFGVAGGKLVERIRSLTFEKVVHQEISWFDDPANSSGAVGARLSTDASTVKSLVGDTLALIVQNLSTIISGLVISFTANWILAFIILAVSPLVLIQGFLQMKFLKGFSADAKVKYEEASQVANEAVGSIRTIASFCAESKVMDMYRKKCLEPEKQGVRLGLTSALAPDTNKAKDCAASIFNILDSTPTIDSSNTQGRTLEAIAGDIELQHVCFNYPTRPHIQIFKDLCLSILAGKTVALVGESGSGKSTVISLLERFYNPHTGRILLDGVDIKEFRLSWLRQQMGLVGQEPILFNDSIRANIAYGKEGVATEEEISAAAKASNAHQFICALPEGYDTSVGERGTQLSGGQKQRIAIARAMLKDPKILLLDEATSALDAESEKVVQEALDRVSVNRTTVVVAHRLTTIRGADMIAVMKNGAVAEKGRHDELMMINDGVYASLVALHMSAS
ncbi:hypothetical protein PHAVU_006G168172 [Phaseolus vulgaris]|uniref:Uncharacterized protein n=1 Tax=Phaseolus vulgaris TaxID=3885 RepID=V7CMK4_PHAVU|nr:hypothetical protein PHAVU_002G233000g [Phaseolus vulgaris]ESW31369.1 hypothetical protein PHAVU_002G233000g [Phaseolus vulgaris]